MNRYVYLEDSILDGLIELSKDARTQEIQEELLGISKIFNLCSSHFQDTWSDQYWELYEDCRKPKETKKIFGSGSDKKIIKYLNELQEIAINLNRSSTTMSPSSKRLDNLEFLDKESNKYKKPSEKLPNNSRKCCECILI